MGYLLTALSGIAAVATLAAFLRFGHLLDVSDEESLRFLSPRALALVVVTAIAVGSVGIVAQLAPEAALSKGPQLAPEPALSKGLSAEEYRDKVRAACLNAAEKARRRTAPDREVVPIRSMIELESGELQRIRSLDPPDELKEPGGEVVTIWDQRLAGLQQIADTGKDMDEQHLTAALATTDFLAVRLNEAFRKISVNECIL